MKGIVQQQAQIRADAATLGRLQAQASGADGQMKALMAANQLAALQQEQLLQIRELLLQEQQIGTSSQEISSGEGHGERRRPYAFSDRIGFNQGRKMTDLRKETRPLNRRGHRTDLFPRRTTPRPH